MHYSAIALVMPLSEEGRQCPFNMHDVSGVVLLPSSGITVISIISIILSFVNIRGSSGGRIRNRFVQLFY